MCLIVDGIFDNSRVFDMAFDMASVASLSFEKISRGSGDAVKTTEPRETTDTSLVSTTTTTTNIPETISNRATQTPAPASSAVSSSSSSSSSSAAAAVVNAHETRTISTVDNRPARFEIKVESDTKARRTNERSQENLCLACFNLPPTQRGIFYSCAFDDKDNCEFCRISEECHACGAPQDPCD